MHLLRITIRDTKAVLKKGKAYFLLSNISVSCYTKICKGGKIIIIRAECLNTKEVEAKAKKRKSKMRPSPLRTPVSGT